MASSIAAEMNEMTKKFEQIAQGLKGSIETINKNFETGAISYIESDDDDEPVVRGKVTQAAINKARRQKLALPKGYKKQFKSFGDFLRVGYRNEDDFKTRHHKSVELLKAANAISNLDSDSAGALVLPEFAPDIAAIYYDNDILSRTNQFTVQGNAMSFPKLQEANRGDGERTGGLLGYWLEEGDPSIGSKPSFDSTELKLKKLCVVVFLTDEIIEDAGYSLEKWVRDAVQREINFMTGDAIFNGIGGRRPLGILNSPITVDVAKQSGQAAKTIVSQNILDMWSRRRAGQPVDSYAWYINQEIEPQLHSMTLGSGGQNGVVYLPPGGLSVAPYATLMGRPVIPTEFNREAGTRGDIVLGNLGQYLTISKGGVQELTSAHVEFLRSQQAIKFTFRIDGRPMYDAPTKPKYGTQTQSDFIALETRA